MMRRTKIDADSRLLLRMAFIAYSRKYRQITAFSAILELIFSLYVVTRDYFAGAKIYTLDCVEIFNWNFAL
jgi:hypothetical protein